MTDPSKEVLDALPLHPMPPSLNVDGHRLRVVGAVARPLALTIEGLRALPQSSLTRDFGCEAGWEVRDVAWGGVPVTGLLDAAGYDEGAAWVTFASGGFATSLPFEEACMAYVALDLDGAPLPVEHGGPARLILPGGICYTSIKWLDRIEVTAERGSETARRIALARVAAEGASPAA